MAGALSLGPVVSVGPFALPILATVLALVQYSVYTFRVAQARIKYDVPAPATTGPDGLVRALRVHANQLEQLPSFLVSLWLFSAFVSPVVGFALALLWLERRWGYATYYVANGFSRDIGRYTVPCYMVINVYCLGALLAALASFVF